MMNTKLCRNLPNLLLFVHRHPTSRFSSSPYAYHHNQHRFFFRLKSNSCLFTLRPILPFSVLGFHHSLYLPSNISSSFNLSFANHPQYSTTTIPIIASSGDNALQKCSWGLKALSIAQDVLLQFGGDLEIFAFKISPLGGGYIYVRLDRLCDEFLSMEDLQSYSYEYKRKLSEAGAVGDIPADVGLEVSSPDADRLLRIPDDLHRFKGMAMRVKYVEHDDSRCIKKGIFFLETIEMEYGTCVWRLADVKENRASSKGRPLSRKQKDWRLKLPFEMLQQVTLYLHYH